MKLTYQDCVELKEAGYIQKPGMIWYFLEKKHVKNNQTGDWYTRQEEWKRFVHKKPQRLTEDGVTWYTCPDLSELIEACGEGEFILERVSAILSYRWIATITTPDTSGGEGVYVQSNGPSPEQAVKNLWIALKK